MTTTGAGEAHRPAAIRRVTLDHPWQWLAAGWADMAAVPGISFLYGGVFAAIGFALLFWLGHYDMEYLILPLGFGFALVGPVAAVGMYESSRRLAAGETPGIAGLLAAFGRNGAQIALVGAFLLIAFIAWVRMAMLVFMLFYGAAPPSLDHLVGALFLSDVSLPFLAVGMATGAVLAACVFAMTAVAVPMLIDRPDTDAMTAMLTSVAAVQRNWRPLMLWAGLIASLTLAGLALFFVGLMVTLPLIGHASWHAYRDLVE
ncbi:DUF2189 domain-containing protein [Magnetospirillum sp. UT-4]|uniref:DUF2189 domain-containing protein n=1 Tax=Magnetospirillum sp. UT-4 TaxID=2681467 RepID=UPI0020C4F57C|nr:DUF2189 domain-containing protein [Magnetospirillum sp. UT-4]